MALSAICSHISTITNEYTFKCKCAARVILPPCAQVEVVPRGQTLLPVFGHAKLVRNAVVGS